MKLLIATGIYPPEIGGPAGYVKGLATELSKQGHDISVVTYGDEKTEKSDKYQIHIVQRTKYTVQRYWKYFWQTYKLARKADLVYVQGPVSEGLPAAVAALFARKPLVMKIVGDYAWEQARQRPTAYVPRPTSTDGTIRTSDVRRETELLDEFVTHRHSGKIRIMEAVERWTASRAKTIIVPSKYLKTVVEKWGMPADKIKVVYNSIAPLPGTTYNVQRTTSKKIILTAVRAVPWKGGDFLCDVIKELPEEFVLAVAGDGPELENWKKHAQEIGVQDRVTWLGKLSRADLADWYRKADLFVLATGYEGFPHVVVEAASLGLPCIVSDKGGNPEIASMFPGLVTVAEYLDKQVWVEAVKHTSHVPRPTSHVGLPESLGFQRMVEESLAALKSAQCLNLESGFTGIFKRLTGLSSLNSDLASQSSTHEDARRDSHDYSNNDIRTVASETKSLDSQILRFSDSQVSEHQRVLSIGTEKKLFEPGKVRDRIVNQLDGFDAVIIVFAKQKFDEQIAPNVRVIFTNSWNKFFYVTDALRIVWKLRKQKFNIITSQDPIETGLVAYLASKFFKTALAIQDHGYHFHGDYYRKESWLNQFRYLFARYVVSKADAVRVVSQRTENALSVLGVAKVKIVRFPVALSEIFKLQTAKSDDVGQATWDKRRKYFLLVGRFVPIKRIDLAIHAFSIAAKKNPEVKLKIVGQGPLENQIKQWITDFDLQNRVEIIPWTENLADLYHGAVATLITSDREGFGMTAAESLACGTPVIMTDVGCAGEVVRTGENGIVVPVGDVVALANAMERYSTNYETARITNGFAQNITKLHDDKNLWRQMSENIYKKYTNEYSFQVTIDKQREIFEALISDDKNFEPKKTENTGLRIMMYTPSLKHNDPVFGFSVRWAAEIARQARGMVLLSRYVDESDIPIGSVGVALGKPWIPRVWKIWMASIKYRKNYDAVFVHMSPEVVLAGWPVWFVLRKPIYLWFAHGATPLSLKLSKYFIKRIFSSSEAGLRIKTPKARFVGQGIDTELFKPSSEVKKENTIITVSRITPAKKYEDALEFLAKFKDAYPEDEWVYVIVGPSLGYDEYIQSLYKKSEQLGLSQRFKILPPVEYAHLPAVYQRAKLFLSTSVTGSIDKVVLEALACGVPVVARGEGYQHLIGVTKMQINAETFTKIHEILQGKVNEHDYWEAVHRDHGIKRLISVILENMK